MSATPIADMVEKLLAASTPGDLIVLAIRACEVSRETSTLASGGLSGGQQADAAERRREWDRKYRRKRRAEQKAASTTPSTRQVDEATLSSSLLSLKGTSEEESKKAASVVDGPKRSKKKPAIALPDDWKPNEAHYAAAKALGLSREFVDSKAVDMRLWAESKDERRPGWDATFHNIIRKDAKTGGRHGFGGSRPLQDDSRSVSRALDRLGDELKQGSIEFAPRPRLLPDESPSDMRLLPPGRSAGS